MGYYDKKEIAHVLDLVKLTNTENKRVKDFSLGMKQRLGIARAIITKPELLILDEPINGLDPVGIKELRELFKMLCKEYGITIIISSHILGEIEQLADTVGVIKGGRLIREVSMDAVNRSQTDYIEVIVNNGQKAAFIIESTLNITNFKLIDGNCIRIYDSTASQKVLSKTLIEHDIEIEGISKKQAH